MGYWHSCFSNAHRQTPFQSKENEQVETNILDKHFNQNRPKCTTLLESECLVNRVDRIVARPWTEDTGQSILGTQPPILLAYSTQLSSQEASNT